MFNPNPEYLGSLNSPAELKNIVVCRLPQDIDFLNPGDLVRSWDRIFEWDETCPTNQTRQE